MNVNPALLQDWRDARERLADAERELKDASGAFGTAERNLAAGIGLSTSTPPRGGPFYREMSP